MEATIRKEKEGWTVYSEDGSKKLGGPYKTKEEAEERLRQVEHFKNAAASPSVKRARYVTTGFLALSPKAFGLEFAIASGVAPTPFEEEGQLAVVRVAGPLAQHPHCFWQDYETIEANALAAFQSPKRAVAICINSPGGDAAGCFELARRLRAMSEEYGKPLGVFIDGQAASAAYAIASSATPGCLFATPTATVASLAVYEMILDQTEADRQMGLRFVFVPSSGADLKLTGNPHIQQSEAQLAHTQGQVDLLTDYFYGLVGDMRGMSQETIRELRGASLLATQGATRGLVDVVSDWAAFTGHMETFRGTAMTTQAKSEKAEEKDEKSPWQEMMATLHGMAEGEDEEKAKKAKKMLRAALADEKPADGDEKKEPESKAEDKEPEKAKAGDGDGDEDDKRAKAATEEEERKAQARAAGGPGVDLAREVQELKANLADRDRREAKALEDRRRADLLASRPDFGDAQRKTLASASITIVEDAVKNWPRVNASVAAAAAAAVPGATPGATDGMPQGLRADQQQLLDRMDRKGQSATQAAMVGSSLVLSNMSPEAAAKRVEEMTKNGLKPRGVPHDMARVTNTEFRTPAK